MFLSELPDIRVRYIQKVYIITASIKSFEGLPTNHPSVIRNRETKKINAAGMYL